MTARLYEWHRCISRSDTYDYNMAVPLDAVVEGWTLMKTRFGLMMTDHATPAFSHETPDQTAFGLAMRDVGAATPLAINDRNDEWIWWEVVHTQRTNYDLLPITYSLSQGPVPFDVRTSESRRVAPAAGSVIWFVFDPDPLTGAAYNKRYYQYDIWAEFLWLKPL